ncbi:MAG: hypothetical protein R3E95_14255 [Thiolinea sp.]
MPEERLILVELNRKFAQNLRKHYPKATVINGAAEALSHLQLKQADMAISGLPLLSIRDRQVEAILQGVFDVLQPEGVLVQFTYGHRCPVKDNILERQGLEAQRRSFVLNNFPPASVYHIRKRRHQQMV